MSAEPAKAASRPVEIDRLLRLQSRLDIILDLDERTGRADVRNSIVLDLTRTEVVAAQTDPPILKSAVGREVMATVIHRDFRTSETTRWGWNCRILGLDNDYRLSRQNSEAISTAAVILSAPAKNELHKTNIRQAYRLEPGGLGQMVEVAVSPASAPVRLVNFSAGGMMLITPAPPAFTVGQTLAFKLAFPEADDLDATTLTGRALVVRLEHQAGDKIAKVGLKFLDLNPDTSRGLQKVMHYFMLEEQRRRNRDL